MKLNITGRHFEVTDAIREHTDEKASRLPRYYSSIQSVDVIFATCDHGIQVEIIIHAGHGKVFVATEKGGAKKDLYTCIDTVFHKVERQLTKAKGKERNPKHTGQNGEFVSPVEASSDDIDDFSFENDESSIENDALVG